GAVRGPLLRARGHGESDQGAAARALCGSDEHRDHAGQPAAAVVFLGGLRAGRDLAPGGARGHGLGAGAGGDHSDATPQAWRARHGECAPRGHRAQQRLSPPAALRPGTGESPAPVSAALLRRARPAHPVGGGRRLPDAVALRALRPEPALQLYSSTALQLYSLRYGTVPIVHATGASTTASRSSIRRPARARGSSSPPT